MRRLIMLGATSLLVAACGGLGAPGFTIPPINLSSLPPGALPSVNPGTGNCALVTPAEVASITGATIATAQDDGSSCTYVFNDGRVVSISVANEIDLSTSKFLMGETAQDVTIGGLPAVSGSIFTLPAVHVQRGAQQLQLQGFALGSTEETLQKMVQIATLAVGRWPQ